MSINPIEVRAAGDTAEVLIYEQIGNSWFEEGVTAKAFAESIKALGKVKTINVRINSPGGSVFEGAAIYNTLANHSAKVHVHIDGAALSAASLIAMAGDEINMAANGFMMIHDPVSRVAGGADEMRRAADMLDKIKATLVDTYVKRTGQDPEEVARMMSEETWLDATEAKELGFITNITEIVRVAAEFDPSDLQFKNTPDRFREFLNHSPSHTPEPKAMPESKPTQDPAQPVAATYEQLVAKCKGADPAFLCKQLEAKATLDQAVDAWIEEQNVRLKAASEKPADPQPQNTQKPGAAPLASNANPGGEGGDLDVIDQWNQAVQAKVKAGMPKERAVSAVIRSNPELHRSYLEAHNEAHGRRRAFSNFADTRF